MKKIFILLLLLPFFSEAQVYQAMPQAGYGAVKRMLFDSVLTLPLGIAKLQNITGGRDTGQIRYNKADSSLYIYSGSQWKKIGGGDTTSLSNRINLKLNATDTINLSNIINGKLSLTGGTMTGNIILGDPSEDAGTTLGADYISTTKISIYNTGSQTALSAFSDGGIHAQFGGSNGLTVNNDGSTTFGSELKANGGLRPSSITMLDTEDNIKYQVNNNGEVLANSFTKLGGGSEFLLANGGTSTGSEFVQKSGDEMTGALTINSDNTNTPLTIYNNDDNAFLSKGINFDCAASGVDQPMMLQFGSTNIKGLAMYASSEAINVIPDGAAFQIYNNASQNFPGQVYFDGGAHPNSSLNFRTAGAGQNVATRLKINATGNVLINKTADDNSGSKLQVNGSIKADNTRAIIKSVGATSTTTTLANFDLNTPSLSAATYRFSILIAYNSAATTTGARFCLFSTTAATSLNFTNSRTVSNISNVISNGNTYGIPSAASTGSLTVGNICKIEGTITFASSAVLSVQFCTGVNSSAITVLPGSYFEYF